MYNFLKKITFFVFGLIALIALCFGIILKVQNNYFDSIKTTLKNSENALFIWGDSQMYRGVDLDTLKSKTDRMIFSSARVGAGMYDFLVFTELVPHSSDVLVSVSIPAQIRQKKDDRNTSGLSLFALELLFSNRYKLIEIKDIIKKNLFLIPELPPFLKK